METHSCETRLLEYKSALLWKIRDFSIQSSCEQRHFLTSQIFKIRGMADVSWTVSLYPRGFDVERTTVYLIVDKVINIFINCDFALVAKTGQNMFAITVAGWSGCEDFSNGTYLGPEKTFSDEEKELLLPNDVLTLSCVLSIKKEEVVSSNRGSVLVDRNLNTLKDDFAKLFQGKKKTDVVLKVGSHQIAAHKTVLACRSTVFSSMFEHDMQERRTNEVDVVDVEFDVLCGLVRFLYTDQTDFNDVGFALKLLVASDKYDVPLLRARCVEYLNDEISEKNVFEVCVAAVDCGEQELKQRCVQLIQSEMSSVTSLADWILQIKSYPQVLDFVVEFLPE